MGPPRGRPCVRPIACLLGMSLLFCLAGFCLAGGAAFGQGEPARSAPGSDRRGLSGLAAVDLSGGACLDFVSWGRLHGDADPDHEIWRAICIGIEHALTRPIKRGGAADGPGRTAWQAPSVSIDRQDNALRIDFRDHEISGSAIARLATIDFLPAVLYGGLIVENARLRNGFRLTDAVVPHALTFQRVTFGGGGKCGDDTAKASLAAQESGRVFDIQFAHFERRLSLIDARMCGQALIADSTFEKALTIRSSEAAGDYQVVKSAPPASTGSAPNRFDQVFIVRNRVEGTLWLNGIQTTGFMKIDRNLAGNLRMEDSAFAGVAVDDNILRSLGAWRSRFSGPVSFTSNQVNDKMVVAITELVVPDGSPGKPPLTARLTENMVDGSLIISIRDLSAYDLDLSYNHAAAGASIMLPAGSLRPDRTVNLDLVGFVTNGTFDITVADYCREEDPLRSTMVPIRPDAYPDRFTAGGSSGPCSGRDAFMLTDLSLAHLQNLSWRLPLTCSFPWIGGGMHFEHWGEADPARRPSCPAGGREAMAAEQHGEDAVAFADPRSSDRHSTPDRAGGAGSALAAGAAEAVGTDALDSTDLNSLLTWADLMETRLSGPLQTISTYLDERGHFFEARRILRDAKQLNYFGGHGVGAIWDSLQQDFNINKGARIAAGILLLPVGFGAHPERAMLLLIFFGIVFYVIYKVYSISRQADWPQQMQPAVPAGPTGQAANIPRAANQAGHEEGYSAKPGFRQFNPTLHPLDFSLLRYSMDAMLPVINLHAYDRYYPDDGLMQYLPSLQHALGWYLSTIFLISATVL